MSVNEFVPFATAPGANVIEQEDYLSDPIVPTGFTMGLLYSAKTNKVWRQSSFVSSCLAHLMWETLDEDIQDNGDVGTFVAQLKETLFRVVAGFEPIGDAPKDGYAYGRKNARWEQVVDKSGDRMNGPLYLFRFPQLGMESVNKQYVDDLVAGLAPIFSPVFTGIPRTPTPPFDASDNRIVNCAWVRDQLGGFVTGVSFVEAGRGLDGGGQGHVVLWVKDYGVTNGMLAYMPARTVKANINYADAPAADILFTTFITELGLAPINSPHFTGIPTVPDPGDNYSNQIASTGWVDGRYLKLTGGTLYNPYIGNLLSIRVPPGHDNYIHFYGDRSWALGATSDQGGAQFGLWSVNVGRYHWLTYPNGTLWASTAMFWVSTNPPAPDLAYGTVSDGLSTSWNLSFNSYVGHNTGTWTRMYDGRAAHIGAGDGIFYFYDAPYNAARTRIDFRHMSTIAWGRLRIIGDNSPSVYIKNVVENVSWGFRNASGHMLFSKLNDAGEGIWDLARFDGSSGSLHTYARQHVEGGMNVYGGDSVYIEGNQTHARIFYANAGRVWLVGCRRDNGHFTFQDVSGGYVERFDLDPSGNCWISARMHAGSFYCRGTSDLGPADFQTFVRINGYLNVGGQITSSGGFVLGGGGQINGGLGVYNGLTVFANSQTASFACQPFAYFQGGAQVYNSHDPFHVGANNQMHLYARIQYWSGNRWWRVGAQTDGNFAWYVGSDYSAHIDGATRKWWFSSHALFVAGMYGPLTQAAPNDLDSLEDAPEGALQIVNSVRPVIHRDATEFRKFLGNRERRPEFLNRDFVRRSRGLRTDQLIESMGEGFHFVQNRNQAQVVDYMELISVLWQSVQELSSKLDEVTSR